MNTAADLPDLNVWLALAVLGVQGWPAPPLTTRSIGFNVVGAREG